MTHLTTKLAPKRYRPFTIVKKISDVVFQLELPHQWKIHNVFHASLLTPYDTILTPFSLSPMTDTVVDSLPMLFLAYCTLVDSDDVMSDNDQVVPRGSDLDPVPLLTDCAFGLSSSFLSCSRR
jgi:hypothetical protein